MTPPTRRLFSFAAGLLTLTLAGCTARLCEHSTIGPQAGEVVTINDREIRSRFTTDFGELLEKTPDHTPHAELVKQLSRTSCTLDLPETGSLRLSPSEIYRRSLASAVIVGLAHHCHSPNCKRTHVNMASGVIIHSDGVVLTSYHVVDSSMKKTMAMGIATKAGDVYLVDEVLAANKSDDVAILKLRNAEGLTAVPIYRDEPVGNPVTVVSHPSGQFYTLTHGYVSRYSQLPRKCIMNITADYAKGSSGGPIFNDRGDLVGLVATTTSISYTNVPLSLGDDNETLALKNKDSKLASFGGKPLVMQGNHQMTVKNCVPSRSILDLVRSP